MARCKHWVFTAYSDEVSFFEAGVYCIFGNEKCPKTGRWHKQGYIVFEEKKRLTALKKIDSTVHWEPKRGSVAQAITYCKKDGDFYEFGEPPIEERSNASVYKECIEFARKGDMSAIEEHHPGQFLRYKRTFEELVKFDLTALDEPRGYWVYGSPGSGKDSNVLKLQPYVKPHNKWWDGYAGEKYVLISDVDHSDARWIGNYLKIWTDRYPFTAEFKGGSRQICPQRFYVTSNYTLADLFEPSVVEALKRRFHVIDFDSGCVTKRPKIGLVDKLELVDF